MNAEYLGAIASFATAVAVFFAACQLVLSLRLAKATFEDSMTQQYREIATKIPLDALIGECVSDGDAKEAREHIFNYLDLCNEQAFLRQKKRISRDTWKDWSDGIQENLQKPEFQRVWQKVKQRAPGTFSNLEWLESKGFSDPAKRRRR